MPARRGRPRTSTVGGKFVLRSGNPGDAGHPVYAPDRLFESERIAQNAAIRVLRSVQAQGHLNKFDRRASEEIDKAVVEINHLAFGWWAKHTSEENRGVWTIDIGWTKITVQLWRLP